MESKIKDFESAYGLLKPGVLERFHTEIGAITMGINCYRDVKGEDNFYIYYIEIKDEFKGDHHFSNFCRFILEKHETMMILAVGSFELDAILKNWYLNGIKFCCHGGDFVWHRNKICDRGYFVNYLE